jgi:site-specific DNA recombinase
MQHKSIHSEGYNLFDIYSKIKKVAVYLRKSREDDNVEDTLAKHKIQILPFIESKDWVYDLFEEIGSGDKIRERPVFMELLDLIEEGKYDAIVVIAVDRLTRGSQKDAGLIEEIFEDSETLIVTPNEIIDFTTEQGKQRYEMLTLFSRNEYRSIKGRLKNGKINGARQGLWTNGKPMFPYVYDKNSGTIVISNEENKNLFLYIVHLFLEEGLGTDKIAVRLNTEKIPTIRRKGVWQQSQVLRMISSGVHAGFVYYGKRRRTKDNRVLLNDPSKVIIEKGTHEAIITEETYNQIKKKINDTRKIPVAARGSTYVFSGLLKCGMCGKSLLTYTLVKQPSYRNPVKREFTYIRNCNKINSDGITKCTNSSVSEKIAINVINDHLNLIFDELSQKPKKKSPSQNIDLLSIHQETIKKIKLKIDRMQESYWDGEISKTKYAELKSIEEGKIKQAEQHIGLIKKSNEYLSDEQENDRMDRWKLYYKKDLLLLTESTIQDKNKNLHKLIEKIEYTRVGNDIEINLSMK